MGTAGKLSREKDCKNIGRNIDQTACNAAFTYSAKNLLLGYLYGTTEAQSTADCSPLLEKLCGKKEILEDEADGGRNTLEIFRSRVRLRNAR